MISKQEILDIIIPILREYNVKEAKLFGSFAKGCQTEYSDVDIYVDSGLRGFAFCGLLGAICDALPLSVDLIDRRCITPQGPLEREIEKTGEVIKL